MNFYYYIEPNSIFKLPIVITSLPIFGVGIGALPCETNAVTGVRLWWLSRQR